MTVLETIIDIIKLVVLMLLMTITLHRYGTLHKWEIKKEREEAKQPEFWEE